MCVRIPYELFLAVSFLINGIPLGNSTSSTKIALQHSRQYLHESF